MGRATKRAARELTGDDGNFVVTTDLDNEFATLDRELPAEAVRRTKRPKDRGGPGHPTRVARKGGLWSDRFERAAGAYNAWATRRCTARPRTWRSSGHGVQGSARQRRQVPAQQGPQPAREGGGDAGAFERRRTRQEASTLSTDAQQLGAVDSMSVRSTRRETLLKLALPAPQGSDNARAG